MPGPESRASLEDEGRKLVERLGGRWTGNCGLCRCPAHDDRRPSLSVRPGRRSLLVHCFAGCSAAQVLRALRAAGNPLPEPQEVALRHAGDDAARARAAAIRIWRRSRPIAGTLAERYLEGRALAAGSRELRYHPRAPLGPFPFTIFRPALVAAVRDESGLVAIHRTFLDPRRVILAPLETPRCGLGRFGQGAVRLGGVASRIGLAEGIETALSASRLFGLPCWATLGTERFRHVALPGRVSELVLFLDHDSGGRRAEQLAREAFAHLPIEVRCPSRPGADWNDVLRAAGGRRRND